ncbi:N-acyl homoserine lactonase family protein [Streptomyces olivaceus]|uniref:N-acyl homoserine lactonase family protein n=1 Tax=Streptomyces olivaceus TaxID=47716 RepID=UPI001CCD2F38|nr:N-acyl homoserine lactonase family protein [Streptomyces olivaceus]MBZ6247310.1 N-acyl homoserine lactonase family protein [Streptomyces olivaceus]
MTHRPPDAPHTSDAPRTPDTPDTPDTSDTYEVLAVRYGEWHTDKGTAYHSFDVYGEQNEPLRIDYFFWVLRNEARTVVVDTGFRPDVAARRQRTLLTPVPRALELAGVEPERVSHVVLTHFHYDHIGNVDLFPGARIVAGGREYRFWTGGTAQQPLFRTAVEADEVDVVRGCEADGRLILVPDQDPGLPGITFHEVTGHTPGQIVVEARTSGRPVVLASDASHLYEEFEKERPFHIASSLPDMYEGLRWLRTRSEDAVVVPGHDALVTERFPADETGTVLRIA